MKYFDRDGKHNFVDLNNAFVGYDSFQCCCERADWFIHSEPVDDVPYDSEFDQPTELPGYSFDADYFKEIVNAPSLDCGGIAIFRLVSPNGIISKFLHLYNCHNGYYGHGFSFTVGGEVKRSGGL